MFSSLNYEKKYLKYKNKYQILKNQYDSTKNILSGGECTPLPNPEEEDFAGGGYESVEDSSDEEELLDTYHLEDIKQQYENDIKYK